MCRQRCLSRADRGGGSCLVGEMIDYKKAIQVGPLLVRRVRSSSAEFRAGHEHHWYGYLCPWNTSKEEIAMVGKLIDVTSRQQLDHERAAYRADLDAFAEVQFAYYEVIDAGA
jgi:hypothetical protein